MRIFYFDNTKRLSDLEKHTFRVGDVIVLRDSGAFNLALVEKEKSRSVCSVPFTLPIPVSPKNVIFSFDYLKGRFGDVQALMFLSSVFQRSYIKNFFEDALHILTYKEDSFEATVLSKLYSARTVSELSVKIENDISEGENDSNDVTGKQKFVPVIKPSEQAQEAKDSQKEDDHGYFQYYLYGRLKQAYEDLLKLDRGKEYIFRTIRQKFPEDFTTSFKAFKKDHPERNIYDEPPTQNKSGDQIVTTAKTTQKIKKSVTLSSSPKRSKEKKDTLGCARRTYSLFKDGYSIDQIAKLRNLTEGTICKHLEDCILQKKITADELMPKKEVQRINSAIKTFGINAGVKVIYEHFNGKYSYAHISWVRAEQLVCK